MRRAALAMLMCLAPATALAQMDPSAMAGQSIPSGDLPVGTVTVRVVREQMSNNVAGIDVELHGAGAVRSATTGEDGRAEFQGVPVGSTVHAVATVEEERLESLPFQIPAAGGMRTLLIAGIGAGTGASGGPSESALPPAQPGSPDALMLGNNSRIAVEFQEDTPTFFYLLDIVNRSSAPVSLNSALIFDMPTGAVGTTVLEGGTPMANARGARVTVSGPFPPGVTQLPIAFRIESNRPRLTIEQVLPLPLDQVALAVQRVGSLRLDSPQAPQVRDATLQGTSFLIASGPRLEAGTPLEITLDGLPYHSRTGLYLALAVAAALVGWAVWAAVRRPARVGASETERQRLEARRERGLAALMALEAERRAGRLDRSAYEARRATLFEQLERVYRALDAEGALPGGGQGLAA